jgi:hypothetical protein
MKKLVLVALVAVGAAVGLRKARSGVPAEADQWAQATDTVPR